MAEHELSRIPYRDLRVHCRRASCRCGPPKLRSTEENEEEKAGAVGTFHFDYTYMPDCGIWLRINEVEEARNVHMQISKSV